MASPTLGAVASERRAVLGRPLGEAAIRGATASERVLRSTGADRGAAQTDRETSFPVSGRGALLRLGGAVANEDLVGHEVLAVTAAGALRMRSARLVRSRP